ncbi:MAG: hypothetical protein WC451_03490 [Patescibacteria group bacterium]|jgi:hypothetical protein
MRQSRNKKAFGLIETLVACSILIIITGALLAVHILTTNNISYVKHRAQAYSLASEGIESVRQIRETNLIDGQQLTSWDSLVCASSVFSKPEFSNLDDNDESNDKIYAIFLNQGACTNLAPIPRKFLKLQNEGEEIVIGGTTYTRKITFRSSGIDPYINAPAGQGQATTENNAFRINVEVSWTLNGQNRNISVSELLTNWKQGF